MNPLQQELSLPAYTGKSDQQAADILNTPLTAGRKLVPLWQVQQWIQTNGVLAALKAAAYTPTNPAFAVAANVYDMVFLGKFENIDLDNLAVKPLLDGLVTAGLLTTTQRAALDALANATTTRAAQLRYMRPITAGDVAKARAAK